MKPVKYLLLITLVLLQYATKAQDLAKSELRRYTQLYKTTVASPKEDDYDVKYVRFDLHPYDTVGQRVSTTCRVTATTMNDYVFEFIYPIDSLFINNVRLNVQTDSDVCTVHLPQPISQNTDFIVKAYYKYLNLWYTNNGGRYTFSQPYGAMYWWPCKQSLTDKIDSVDMNVYVPDTLSVSGNGLLKSKQDFGNGVTCYEWKETYPIDYYLVSFAAAKFNYSSYYTHFSGTNDSILISNYIENYLNWGDYQKQFADSLGLMVDYFSTLFGRYPFWKEKYGCSDIFDGSGTSMENQTMTTMGYYGLTVYPHELTHQWFGDNVTCGSWRDTWLNEGFASYGEYLYAMHFYGMTNANSKMNIYQAGAKQYIFSTYLSDTVDVFNAYYTSNVIYDKGACIVHMLRHWVNDDNKFFHILQDYQKQFGGKAATTADLQAVFSKDLNQDMSGFFNQWVYGKGYPEYTPTWNQISNVLFLKIKQRGIGKGGTPLYTMPIDIRLYSTEGDTTVRVFNTDSIQIFQILCDRKVDSIAFDPDSWILCNKYAPSKDTTINTLPADIQVYPNPVNGVFYLKYKQLTDPLIILYDIAGRKVAQQKIQLLTGIETIDIHQLPKGIYFYKVFDKGEQKVSGKILKE